MGTPLVKSVGADMQNPGKFYWDIKSANLEQVIVKRGFDSLQEAQEDLEASIDNLAKSPGIINAAIVPQD